jgi:hypothetical protein
MRIYSSPVDIPDETAPVAESEPQRRERFRMSEVPKKPRRSKPLVIPPMTSRPLKYLVVNHVHNCCGVMAA